jgi:hypothetical protein
VGLARESLAAGGNGNGRVVEVSVSLERRWIDVDERDTAPKKIPCGYSYCTGPKRSWNERPVLGADNVEVTVLNESSSRAAPPSRDT